MRIEQVNGRYLLCGYILPVDKIKVGQVWAPASGTDREVVVIKVNGDWVTYAGIEQPVYEKDCFSFQCRYCLVLDV